MQKWDLVEEVQLEFFRSQKAITYDLMMLPATRLQAIDPITFSLDARETITLEAGMTYLAVGLLQYALLYIEKRLLKNAAQKGAVWHLGLPQVYRTRSIVENTI